METLKDKVIEARKRYAQKLKNVKEKQETQKSQKEMLDLFCKQIDETILNKEELKNYAKDLQSDCEFIANLVEYAHKHSPLMLLAVAKSMRITPTRAIILMIKDVFENEVSEAFLLRLLEYSNDSEVALAILECLKNKTNKVPLVKELLRNRIVVQTDVFPKFIEAGVKREIPYWVTYLLISKMDSHCFPCESVDLIYTQSLKGHFPFRMVLLLLKKRLYLYGSYGDTSRSLRNAYFNEKLSSKQLVSTYDYFDVFENDTRFVKVAKNDATILNGLIKSIKEHSCGKKVLQKFFKAIFIGGLNIEILNEIVDYTPKELYNDFFELASRNNKFKPYLTKLLEKAGKLCLEQEDTLLDNFEKPIISVYFERYYDILD